MSNQFKDYLPVIEIAVLKSMGEAGISGGRDVLIKVDALQADLNPCVLTVTIENIENANLSLKISGFDLFETDEERSVKFISGSIKVIASTNNGANQREYTLHTPQVEVQPINLKDSTYPPISEVKSQIERAWFNSFAEALSDIIDQTTVITGNLSIDNPYNLNAEEASLKPSGKSKSNNTKPNSKKFWIGVVGAAIVVFLVSLLLINYLKSDNAQPGTELREMPGVELQEITDAAPSPQEQQQVQNESEAIESELLDEFGLESNVSLD